MLRRELLTSGNSVAGPAQTFQARGCRPFRSCGSGFGISRGDCPEARRAMSRREQVVPSSLSVSMRLSRHGRKVVLARRAKNFVGRGFHARLGDGLGFHRRRKTSRVPSSSKSFSRWRRAACYREPEARGAVYVLLSTCTVYVLLFAFTVYVFCLLFTFEATTTEERQWATRCFHGAEVMDQNKQCLG